MYDCERAVRLLVARQRSVDGRQLTVYLCDRWRLATRVGDCMNAGSTAKQQQQYQHQYQPRSNINQNVYSPLSDATPTLAS